MIQYDPLWSIIIPRRHQTDRELSMLEAKVGQLFYFNPANPSGRYRLKLANPYESAIAQKLVQISSEEELRRRAAHEGGGAINTSQKGDWDNWRNEWLTTTYQQGKASMYDVYDKKAKTYHPAFADGAPFNYADHVPVPLPPHGVLRFLL